MELACQCPAVVCCRCAPTQKAQIVRLLQERTGKLTCAVGRELEKLWNQWHHHHSLGDSVSFLASFSLEIILIKWVLKTIVFHKRFLSGTAHEASAVHITRTRPAILFCELFSRINAQCQISIYKPTIPSVFEDLCKWTYVRRKIQKYNTNLKYFCTVRN